MTIRGTALLLLGTLAFGCNPDTDQPSTEPGEEVVCNNQYFSIAVQPVDGGVDWRPDEPMDISANIKPKVNPTGPDGVTSTTPPYDVKVNAPVAGDDSKTAPLPEVMPLDTEGKEWLMKKFILSSGISWEVLIEITDAKGKMDACTVIFDFT